MIEFIIQHNLNGVATAIVTFLIVGIFHPLVIKGEYYFGVRIWWLFLLMGLIAIALSLFIENLFCSTILAIWGASSLWSIKELFEQRERVRKGWFPKRKQIERAETDAARTNLKKRCGKIR